MFAWSVVRGLAGGLLQHFALTWFMNAFSWFFAAIWFPLLSDFIAACSLTFRLLVSPCGRFRLLTRSIRFCVA